MHQLSVETVRLLSSSQVITSVHGTVKELVENSLDAKATNIEVKLENYGLDLIEIRDNGVGVKREDALFMAQPHYTSKLTSTEDLSSLTTYGFRGEALASIAAVSDVRITTCTEVDDVALVYTIDHSGQVIATKPSHLGRGTTVSITNLFRNLPVRKQYYKNAKHSREDFKKAEDVLLAFGIAHPMVRLVLKHNKSVVWQKMQTTDFRSNLNLVLGSNTMQNMVPISFQSFEPMLKVHGFVPKVDADPCHIFRTTPERLFLFVNQRPVVVKPVIQVLKQAFAGAFPSQAGRYPVAVVCIDLLPSDLDVNLEPNKTAVLFHDMEFLLTTLTTLLSGIYSRSKGEDNTANEANSSPPNNDHTQAVLDTADANSTAYPHSPLCDTADTQERPSIVSSSSSPVLISATPLPPKPTDYIPQAPDDLEDDDFDEILASEVLELECQKGTTVIASEVGTIDEVSHEQTDGTLESIAKDSNCSSGGLATCDISSDRAGVDKAVRDTGLYQSSSLAPETPIPPPGGSGDSEARGLCERLQPDCRAMLPEPYELLDISEFEDDSNCVELDSDMAATHELSSNRVDSVHSRADDDSPLCQADNKTSRSVEGNSQKATLSQWSRGEALKDSSQQPVEPVRVLKPAGATPPVLKQSKLTYKGPPPVYDMIDSRPVKRKAACPHSEGDHKKQKKGNSTPRSSILLRMELHRREKLKEKEQDAILDTPSESVPCILSDIEQRNTQRDSSGETTPPHLADTVIGYCNPPGVWLVLLDKNIACFDALGASESVLHQKLLQSHKLLREPLPMPLVLSESILGGSENMSLLVSLKTEQSPLDGCCFCCDDNIVKNGFGVVQRTVGGQLRLELSHTCKMLSSYGVHDLRELLEKIKAYKRQETSTSLLCRPTAVEQFLQREAARMAKARLSSLGKAEVQDLLAAVASNPDKPHANNAGLHFHNICTLSNDD